MYNDIENLLFKINNKVMQQGNNFFSSYSNKTSTDK